MFPLLWPHGQAAPAAGSDLLSADQMRLSLCLRVFEMIMIITRLNCSKVKTHLFAVVVVVVS